MNKPIQIFKPGKRTAMNGVTLDFSDADLQATAAAYDPAKHEAPLVVGHPKHDDPAYGWAASLAYAGGALEALPGQVNADFAEMVGAGAFKKVSASFYLPDAPNNPVPGVYYLRHIGFLGAQAPAVKGLRNPEFADAEEGVIEFSEWDDIDNASLWRSLREWIITKFGLEEADRVVPGYTVKNLEQSAQDELNESMKEDQAASAPAPAFAEPQPKGDEMSAEDKARLSELEAENAALKAKEVAVAEAETKRKADARHAEHVAFAEGLIQQGRLLPAHKDMTVATLDFMAGQESVVEFGEGDAKQPLLDAHKAYLAAQPKQVEFGEVAGAGNGEAAGLSDTEVAQRAREYKQRLDAKGENISFAEAVDAVAAGKDK